MARIGAHLLTGFLGSGKTTLLRRLLAQPELTGTAVLINEFGEVGLDHLLIERLAEDVVLLKSGCVCCTIRGDVKEALMRLSARAAAGEIPAFSRVIIETTGLADPAPLVATFLVDPMLRHQYKLESVVTVVEAVNGPANLDRFEEAVRQAAAADRLIISKTDIAPPDVVDGLAARLSALNPAAVIMPLNDSENAPAWLLIGGAEARLRRLSPPPENRHGNIRSFVLTADNPIDWAAFGLWLSMLLNRHGDKLLRVKGLIHVTGAGGPVLVQGVQHIIHRPEHLAAWPGGEARTELVMIARGLDSDLVCESFHAFLGLTAQQAHPRASCQG